MHDDLLNILLVEDNAAHRTLIQRAFLPFQKRYHLAISESLHGATDALAVSPPDLLLVDLLLPDGKGIELLSTAENGDRQFPTIVMTSHGDEQVAVEAMKAGALDYVVKSAETLSDMPHIVERALREWGHLTERQRAEEKLRKSLQEKTLLLQEIHHRTRNNMQVIDSLLEFQSHEIEESSILKIFQSIRNRIRAMALVQEKLYSNDLSTVNLKVYLQELAALLVQSYWKQRRKIDFSFKLDAILLSVDTAMPCGLMMNELLSNALKYAFSGEDRGEPKIWITLCASENGMIEFQIGDNGRGLPDDISIAEPSTLGFRLVQLLVHYQLKGSFQCLERHQGTQFLVRFNPPQYNKRFSTPEAGNS